MLRFNLPNGEYVPVLIDISIHLMLRFNAAGFRGDIDSVWFQYILCYGSTHGPLFDSALEKNFNTSYVTVQRFKDVQPWNALLDFNTSYVTVQRTVTIKLEFIPEFQYILCYGSTFFCTAFYRGRKHFNTSYVTVQLIPTHNKNPPKNISIHLMLRFNNSKYLRIIPKYKISIHLMLRFNTDISPVFCNFFKFQYILCYGSTPCLNQYKILIAIFQYILCYGSTPWLPYPQHFLRQFQYILCYGSTMPKTTNAKDKTAFQYILCYGSTSNSNLTITDSGIFQYILCYGSTKLI